MITQYCRQTIVTWRLQCYFSSFSILQIPLAMQLHTQMSGISRFTDPLSL